MASTSNTFRLFYLLGFVFLFGLVMVQGTTVEAVDEITTLPPSSSPTEFALAESTQNNEDSTTDDELTHISTITGPETESQPVNFEGATEAEIPSIRPNGGPISDFPVLSLDEGDDDDIASDDEETATTLPFPVTPPFLNSSSPTPPTANDTLFVQAPSNSTIELQKTDRGSKSRTIAILGKDGLENIAYFAYNGYAIIDGDVVFGKESDLLSLRPRNIAVRRALPSVDKRALSIYPFHDDEKWPGANILYRYANTASRSALKPQVDAAIARWKSEAPWLRFTHVGFGGNPKVLTVSLSTVPVCSAPNRYPPAAPMFLHSNCNIDAVTHAFGHVLGLQHEHQRPDREDYINFRCSALSNPPPSQADCSDKTCRGKACYFRRGLNYDHTGPFDDKSIMMFHRTAHSWNGFSQTLIPKPGYEVLFAPRSRPSSGDFARVCKLYRTQCLNGGGTGSGTYQTCVPGRLPGQVGGCHQSTSCISTTSGKNYCACAAGFKGAAGGGSGFRLGSFPGFEHLVFVNPGMECTRLCDNTSVLKDMCREVVAVAPGP